MSRAGPPPDVTEQLEPGYGAGALSRFAREEIPAPSPYLDCRCYMTSLLRQGGPLARRDRSRCRYRLADVQARDIGHERVRARGRRRLPHLFRLCARTGRPLGHVPVVRPPIQGAPTRRGSGTAATLDTAVQQIGQFSRLVHPETHPSCDSERQLSGAEFRQSYHCSWPSQSN